MSLSIYDEVSSMRSHNPYALTAAEAAAMESFNNMSADDKGAIYHASIQRAADQAYLDSLAMDDLVSSNVIQHLAGGGVSVGGGLRPDALVTISGLEMTVQQAIDAGVYSSEVIGQQVSELQEPENDQLGMLGGVPMANIVVTNGGQVVTEDGNGNYWLFDEAASNWIEAETY